MDNARRSFLKQTAAAGLAAAVPAGLLAAEPAKSASEVYVGKGTAAATLPKIIEKLGGMGRFVKPGARVLLKPNMSFANPPEWATTTSPESVYTIAKMCLDAGAKRVIVCDNTLHEPELCKQKTGMAAALKSLKGVVLYTPKQDAMFINKTDARAKELASVDIVKELFQSDCFISISAAKSHSAGGVSFNIKGLMGLVKNRDAFHREMDLHKAIADQLYYMTPTLCLIDATRALLDNGPAGPGKTVELNTFVGGLDPVAVDAYGVSLASWYGRKFDGKQVKHLKYAAELGFGNLESSMIKEIPV